MNIQFKPVNLEAYPISHPVRYPSMSFGAKKSSSKLNKPETKPSAPVSNDPKSLISEAEFVVFDLETTGLKSNQDDVIEVSALKYKGGKLTDKYTTLVRPTQPISDEVKNITGISNPMVQNAKLPSRMLEELAEFVGESPILVGHNAQFDIDFIRTQFDKYGLPKLKSRFSLDKTLCTLTIAMLAIQDFQTTEVNPLSGKSYTKYQKGAYTLSSLAKFFKIKNPGAHRAENDVQMTAQLLYRLVEYLKNQKLKMDRVSDLQEYQGEAIVPFRRAKK